MFVVHKMVAAITPLDDLEAVHRADVLRWLESTDDIYRRAKPATPDRHLVSYIPIVDRTDGSSLLVSHVNAGRWLPPGGHVETDEHPADAARREAREELGVPACFNEYPPSPSFVTVTMTGGVDHGHTDVSLWFVLSRHREMPLVAHTDEFTELRWWRPAEILAAASTTLDPHYERFLTKLGLHRYFAGSS